jgi:hypothetical protein
LWFDGSARGLPATDLDAISIVGNTLYFSTDNSAVPPGAGGSGDDADIYRWNGANSYTRVVDASAAPYNLQAAANVDGLIVVDATHFYLSFSTTSTTVPVLGTVQDEDVVYYNAGTWSVSFDGTAPGLTVDALDLDAISFASGALPPGPPSIPPFSPLYFSTAGAGAVPGVAGPYQSADVYFGNGTSYSLMMDASASGMVLSQLTNVDGFDRVDDTHFYVSFNSATYVTGLGIVRDEDVVYYNAGTWSLYFDGSAHGLGGNNNLDLDAISVVGATLYFSTRGTSNPPGVRGTADDADIYSWNGTAYSRVIDASAAPYRLPGNANVDGFVRVDATHFYLSFSADTTVPVLGAVQDEDVIYYNAGTWSVYYDGTAQGLVADNQDVDAFDVP